MWEDTHMSVCYVCVHPCASTYTCLVTPVKVRTYKHGSIGKTAPLHRADCQMAEQSASRPFVAESAVTSSLGALPYPC